MINLYIIYLNTDTTSGYYTGKSYFLPSGEKYPGVVEDVTDKNILSYTYKLQAIIICQLIASFCINLSVEILLRSNLSTAYTAVYENGKLESEQQF